MKHLRSLELGLSDVRKTKEKKVFSKLRTLEEVSLIRQAKREHHPVEAEFSGKALINLDEDTLYQAIEEGIIDRLIEDTPLLRPFLKEAIEEFKLSPNCNLELIEEAT